jgi:hypothetical protein
LRSARTSLLLIVLFAVLAGGMAYAIASRRSEGYASRAVLTVVPVSRSAGTVNPGQSSALALTFAAFLRDGSRLQRAAARSMDAEVERVRERTTVSTSEQTPMIGLTYRAPTAAEARRGARALARASVSADLYRGSPLTPSSLFVVETASPARESGGQYRSTGRILVGGAATSPFDGDAQAANRLAANYAGLIPESEAILADAVRRSDGSLEDLRDRLKVVTEPNTSLLEMRYGTDGDGGRALRVMRSLVDSVLNADDALIASDLIQLVESPKLHRAQGVGAIPAALIGALLGAVVGAAVTARLRRP